MLICIPALGALLHLHCSKARTACSKASGYILEMSMSCTRAALQGSGGEQDQDDGGFDWSSLGRLVSSYQGAAQQSNGNPSFGSFQNM